MRVLWMVVLLTCAVVSQAVGQDQEANLDLVETPYSPAGYERLLKEYVVKVPLEGGGFESRFDYPRFWEATDQDKIRDDIRARFLSVDPEAMDRRPLFAWAVNAYNFLVIDIVVENLGSTDGGELLSIADLGGGSFAVFDEKRFEIGGELYSLNRIEHHFVFGDIDRSRGHVPKGLDPRLHFALVCAAKGCPPLWPEPLIPGRLDEQLEAMTRNALRSPRHLQVSGETVRVSRIFDWYAVDFGRVGLRQFLVEHAPEEAADRLALSGAPIMADIDWDWSLNRP